MNPPTEPTDSTETSERSPAVATRAGSVILGVSSLRLGAMMRPKTWLQFGLMACAVVVITRISVRPEHPNSLSEWSVSVFTLKILPLICLVMGGGFLRNEIRSLTIEYIWTRPVRKWHLVLGAYVSTVVFALVQAIIFTGLIYATASVSGIDHLSPELPRLLLAQLACVVAYSSIAVALGVLTGKYMIAGIFYGLAVEVGISKIPTLLNQLAVSHHALAMIETMPGATWAQTSATMLGAWAGCLIIAVIALALAMFVFSTREYALKSGD